ncbi:MAG: hypothetical protein JSR26_11970 [Proteobacteria bacterium]|nr:hypothetical protein [Pseudomonadota bacterium]
MNARDIETTLRARASFEASVEHLDRDTRQRLRAIRGRALDGGARPAAWLRWAWSGGVVATAALALAVFLPHLPHAPVQPAGTPAHGDTAAIVLASASSPAASTAIDAAVKPVLATSTTHASEAGTIETADPDMLSDLDFYDWLSRQHSESQNTGG